MSSGGGVSPGQLGGRGGEIIQTSERFPIFFSIMALWLPTELHALFPFWVVSHVRVPFPSFSGRHFLLLLLIAQWLLVVVGLASGFFLQMKLGVEVQ